MRMMSMVILVLLSMCIGIRVAHAQAEPPYWIRVLAEEESVTVRVFDIVEGRATSTGSGFVAYDDGDTLTLLTAKHVVAAALEAPNASVEVRCFGRGYWLPVTDCVPMPDDDLAVMTMERRFSPFDDTLRATSIPVAPAIGTPAAWLFGYSYLSDRLEWRELFATELGDSRVTLRGRSLAHGFSGSLIVTGAGRLALLTDRGPNAQGHVGITCWHIADVLENMGIDASLDQNAAFVALDHSLNNQLTIGMFTIDKSEPRKDRLRTFWGLLDLEQYNTDTGAFVGSALTGESGDVRPRRSLRVTRDSIVGSLNHSHHWTSNGRGRLDELELVYDVDGEYTDEQFLVLRAETSHATTYLAIPRGSSELLVTRSMATASTERGTHVDWPREADFPLQHGGDFSRDGRIPAFMNVFKTPPTFSALEFRIPRSISLGAPITISGRPVLTQENLRHSKADEHLKRISKTIVRVRNTLSGEILGETSLGQDGGQFAMRISEPPDETLSLEFYEESRVLSNGRSSLVTFLEIEYEGLDD